MSLPHPTAPSSRSAPVKPLVAALLGNPNTGKTTLFNALSGLNHRVGNYPGVTVESRKGSMTCDGVAFEIVDLPGTYSLAPRSPDEMVTVDVILGQQAGEARPDVVVCIADASNLERNLYLTTQALELGVPVVVALNMIDVAEAQGVRIDAPLLEKQFGVPVVPIQANKRRGLDELRSVIAKAATGAAPSRGPVFPEAVRDEVASLRAKLGEETPTYLAQRLLFDIGGYIEQRFAGRLNGYSLAEARSRLGAAGCPVPATEARTRYGWIREAVAGCVERPDRRPDTATDWLDRLLTHRVWGTLVFLVVMFLVFNAIYVGAKPLMESINGGKDAVSEWVGGLLPPGPFTSLLTDGVINGVGSVVVFLPQILILFAFIAVLEDCGYMARAAFLMDRLMSRAGLSGKSFIPLLSSVACAIPGIMATRVIEDRRDRFATILVAPLMSCSARLPVYILLIGAFLTTGYPWWLPGVVMFAMYSLGLILAPLIAWALKGTLLRGKTPVFVLEMPSYKWPSLRVVARRVIESGWMFVRRAGTVILACMVLVWVLMYFPAHDYPERIAALDKDDPEAKRLLAAWKRQSILGRVGRAIEPGVRPLGWDWRIGVAALASFPAREVIVGTLGVLFEQGEVEADDAEGLGEALKQARWQDDPARPLFTVPVALSLMVFFALCCQCASTLAVIRRETGTWRWPAFTFVYMTALAYVGALLVYQIGSFF
jgi:ferrous iron transport protein B